MPRFNRVSDNGIIREAGFPRLKFLSGIHIVSFIVRDLFLMRDRATSISQVAIYRAAICVSSVHVPACLPACVSRQPRPRRRGLTHVWDEVIKILREPLIFLV